MLRKLIKSDSS